MPENSQYIVSARKYRPDSFEDLIGQDNIVKTLKNSIVRGKLAHAYLFCGPRGVGKTSAARIFAKTINCSSPTADMEPCGQCESCVSFQEGRSYCIHELDAASNNGVEDIKTLMDQVQIPPQVGKYSVYIIDEVHMLTQSAFNAFLKTLEEPPAHAIFILATTEKHKILPTILSRCQTYDFNRISIPDIVRNLRDIATKENINIDDESLHIIARKADGAMRDALTIFDQTVAFCGTDVKYEDVIRNLNVLDYEHCFHLTDAMLANDYGSALLEFDNVLSKGFNALYFVASLSTHFRNLMVAKNGALDALLEFPDSLKLKYKEQADRCPIQFLYDALSVTSQCESGYKESINPRLHIEFALMKLCFLTGGPVSLRPAAPVTAPQAAPQSAPRTAPQPVPRPQPQPEPAQPDTAPAKPVNVAETPVAQPVAETAAPARRKRTSKSAALSLDAIKEESKATSSEVADSSLSDRIPENAEITGHWQKLPEQYRSRPRLYSTLATTKLNVKEMDGYKLLEFYVMNLAQKTWVEQELLRELEDKLQKSLGTKRVRLAVEVIPEEKVEKKIYMPEDKAKAMMAGNEEIRNLVKDLDLDVK
ncbi:MAG: DNA polymerase III subunit gamma/tau [Candidatus Cryptobacteroides sp.]|nr:DNA polymerase III subunit gamma/tau [Bacteroides sp.]MDY5301624.1 DNA polymerase III subunit gamma/tau [Candidatus Cryptobacteroides sp.]MDY5407839.1 DNA polymerase III subunit gamma/tau [Candidatus Cryptobacteroides sp.]